MKKILVLVFCLAVFVQAKGIRRVSRSTLEIAPKASLYIGDDVYFGIGAECVANPIKQVGIRLNITEVVFGNGTQFYFNHGALGFSGLSLDGLFYIPMAEIEPYVHGGFGLGIVDTPGPGGSNTFLSFRFGMGLNYPVNPRTKIFVEPGIIVYDGGGGTEAMFRLSFGARFGIF
ncbi:MAG: hypothetical protein ACPL28_07470 [bacterium]